MEISLGNLYVRIGALTRLIDCVNWTSYVSCLVTHDTF